MNLEPSKKISRLLTIKETLISQFILVVLPVLIIFFLIIFINRGEFTYTLDDPYIHLTLAKNITYGNYGINMGEISAPSSSILWPFLLVPFSLLNKLFEFAPLIVNTICLAIIVQLLSIIFEDVKYSLRQLLIFLILLSLNLYGLVFTGLEHVFQVMLVVAGLLPILKEKFCIPPKKAPIFQVIALILLPLIRYEGLAISVPIFLFIIGKREPYKALLGFFLLMLLIGSYSLFLFKSGLGILPSSVMSKMQPVFVNLIVNLKKYCYMLIPVSIITVVFWKHYKPMAVTVIATTVLHFLFGQYGWQGRYEVYYMMFIVLICIRLIIDYNYNLFPSILALPALSLSLVFSTLATPINANTVYNLQVNMANIAYLLHKPIAVTDIGLTSLRSGQYIYDLVGLGAIDVLTARRSGNFGPDWVGNAMKKKCIKFAFVFTSSFKDSMPKFWIKVGDLIVKHNKVSVLSFYGTDKSSSDQLQQVLIQYSYILHDKHVHLIIENTK